MKILMVSIPNHHFFQWTNQLKDSGHEIYWFDVTDGGPKVEKLNWVHQIKGWQLRFNYPFRHAIKKKFPDFYTIIQKYNRRNVQSVFQKKIKEIRPDIIHCFEMKLAGIPVLPILEKYSKINLIYSSWGSDLYFYKELGLSKMQVEQFLTRVDYLITDCKRDFKIAEQIGFGNIFLGVFPGNGGILINEDHITSVNNRKVFLIKGYEDGVGKALIVLKALELIPLEELCDFKIMIYSADEIVKHRISESPHLSALDMEILTRDKFISNEDLLKIMGESAIHIGNSISDGMPNALLEAMGMGAFPIQSNPGNVAAEVINNGANGYLINNPLNETAIAELIKNALKNSKLRAIAQEHNIAFIAANYNRAILQKEIIEIYQSVYLKNK